MIMDDGIDGRERMEYIGPSFGIAFYTSDGTDRISDLFGALYTLLK